MKTLHKYLVGQVVASLLLTVAVFTFILLLMNALKDLLPLVLGGHIGPWLALKSIALLLPFCLVYALPMGLITATLLVIGRISADQELTAARAGGISLLSLISPVLLISILCCALSAWFNMDLGPRSRVMFTGMRGELLAEFLKGPLPEDKTIRDFKNYILYIEKNDHGILHNLTISKLNGDTNVDVIIMAKTAHLDMNTRVADMTNVQCIYVGAHGNSSQRFETLSLPLEDSQLTGGSSWHRNPSDMTFGQLREDLATIQTFDFSGKCTNMPVVMKGLQWMGLDLATNATPEEVAKTLKEARKRQPEAAEEDRVLINNQVAFAFSCFCFTLVGIPLGVRVHRRETNVNIVVALMLVSVYYGFIMLGSSLSSHPELYPHLIVWIPVFLFQAIGAVLLWRANRGI